MNALTRYLGSNTKSLKVAAETCLKENKDFVVLAKSGQKGIAGGMTDISFEKRKSDNKVSLYFSADKAGIEGYRKIAALVCDQENVELKYSPHLGQSRITFDWNHFWKMLGEREKNGISEMA